MRSLSISAFRSCVYLCIGWFRRHRRWPETIQICTYIFCAFTWPRGGFSACFGRADILERAVHGVRSQIVRVLHGQEKHIHRRLHVLTPRKTSIERTASLIFCAVSFRGVDRGVSRCQSTPEILKAAFLLPPSVQPSFHPCYLHTCKKENRGADFV